MKSTCFALPRIVRWFWDLPLLTGFRILLSLYLGYFIYIKKKKHIPSSSLSDVLFCRFCASGTIEMTSALSSCSQWILWTMNFSSHTLDQIISTRELAGWSVFYVWPNWFRHLHFPLKLSMDELRVAVHVWKQLLSVVVSAPLMNCFCPF